VALVSVLVVGASGGIIATTTDRAPRGTFRFIERTASGRPVRWNPCEPIRYAVNLTVAPTGALEDLQEAIRRVSKATGIPFVYEGDNGMTVGDQVEAGYTRHGGGDWLPVLVDWLPHDEFTTWDPRQGVVAFAHPQPGSASLAGQYVSGIVVVDADAGLSPGFGFRSSDGLVLQHELGHLIGLAHVSDPDEIMYASARFVGNPIADWGPGDREGLRELGVDAGCLRPAESAFSTTTP
jgi:matrixin